MRRATKYALLIMLVMNVNGQYEYGQVDLSSWGKKNLVSELQDQSQSNDNQVFTDFYPTFQYSLVKTQPLKPLTASKLFTCGSVLYPGYISFQKKTAFSNLVYGDYRKIPIDPIDGKTPAIPNIAVCNPWSDFYGCTACVHENTGYEAVVRVFRSDVGLQLETTCVLLIQEDCGVRTCQQGEYASTYLNADEYGFVVSNTRCIQCPPGTWLTCINDNTCQYTIPSSQGVFETGGAIYDIQDPVGGCFSCDTAGRPKVHYGQTSRKTIIPVTASDPLKWYCPGRDAPPVMCNPPYASANANSTGCVCEQGYYAVNSMDKCQICPPGSMCADGERQECPDGSYQDASGATMCNSCFLDDGQTNFCESVQKKMRKCTGSYKSQIPLCVGCNACIRPYSDNPAGVVDCY